MTQNHLLPRISQATRYKLQSYGFKNQLYRYLQLPSFYIPRAPGFDSYTYLIMGLSMAGGIFAKNYGKKYGFPLLPFLISFLAAPSAGFYAKKEADFFYSSSFSKKNPEIELQHYPILKQSYDQVKTEAKAQIKSLTQRVRMLQEKQNRGK